MMVVIGVLGDLWYVGRPCSVHVFVALEDGGSRTATGGQINVVDID